MPSFPIELTVDQVKFLKVRFNVTTDGELRERLQRIAESLIAKQFPSSLDKEIKEENND